MKKSELKKYVRENIISELSESTEDEITATKELTKAVQDLDSAKKEAGIEEGAIDPAEYGDIGAAYLKGFNKPHSLNLDQLEKLGREIVKRLYKGDFDKAKSKFLNEEIPASSMLKINSSVTTVASAAQSMLDFYNQMAEKETMDFLKNANFKIAIDKFKKLVGDKGEVTENEDEEKTEKDAVAQAKAARGKHKKLDIAVKALKDITTEMKSIAREYSKADGVEKEKIKDQLKTKTAKKKELESLVAKLEKNVI